MSKRVLIVTRHPGARRFLQDFLARNFPSYESWTTDHIDSGSLDNVAEDFHIVVGVLPTPLIYELSQRGVETWALVLPNIPQEKRGKELSIEEMRECGAEVRRVVISTWEKLGD